jgi:hypothetical protein
MPHLNRLNAMFDKEHQHEGAHTSRTDRGTLYEVCWCGAVRFTRDGRIEDWHACASFSRG